jgi:hypothetical protein
MARHRQRDLVAMMVKALMHHGAPAAAELWHVDDRLLLAQDPGPRQGANRDRLAPGAESADVADQLEAGKPRVWVIGADLLDILAHAAEFGLADALALDKDLDRFELHETDDPALDPQEFVGSDDRLVNEQLHRRPVENGVSAGSASPGSTAGISTCCGGMSTRSGRRPISPSSVLTLSSGSIVPPAVLGRSKLNIKPEWPA